MKKMRQLFICGMICFLAEQAGECFQAPPIDQMRGGQNNNLFPNETASDQEITQKIKDAMREDYYLAPYVDNIEIYTISGVVTISGRMTSSAIKLKITKKAQNVEGVRHVYNNIEIVHIWE